MFVCGLEALDVQADDRHVLATTSPASDETRGNLSCHVVASRSEGRSAVASGAFVYVGPPPEQLPLDLSGDWSVDLVIRLAIRLWPYVLSVIVGISMLHWLYVISTECLVQRRMEQAHSRVPELRAPDGL